MNKKFTTIVYHGTIVSIALGFSLVVFLISTGGFDPSDFELIKGLAEGGDADAQLNVGRIYANGVGVSQDDAAAAKWYRLASEQGQADAQVFLGMAYETGRGVPQDHVEAYVWFDVASSSIKNAELRRDRVKVLLSSSQLVSGEQRAERAKLLLQKGAGFIGGSSSDSPKEKPPTKSDR